MRLKILSAILFISAITFGKVYSQGDKLEVEVEVINPTKKRSADGKITISLNQGKTPYNIYITEAPIIPTSENDILYKKENIKNVSYTFDMIKRGSYYIFIKDAENKTNFKEVKLDISNNI